MLTTKNPPFLSGRSVDVDGFEKRKRENAIRIKAYLLWEQDGCPTWTDPAYYWTKAILSYEENE